MTDDEYNLSLVMKHEITSPSDSDMWYMVAHHLNRIRTDQETAKRIYPDIRRVFNRKLNDDRKKLKEAGLSEPTTMPSSGNPEELEIWNSLGSALQTLYRFKTNDNLPAFLSGPPNLGNLRRIDLDKIATEPSPAYTDFLSKWEEALRRD